MIWMLRHCVFLLWALATPILIGFSFFILHYIFLLFFRLLDTFSISANFLFFCCSVLKRRFANEICPFAWCCSNLIVIVQVFLFCLMVLQIPQSFYLFETRIMKLMRSFEYDYPADSSLLVRQREMRKKCKTFSFQIQSHSICYDWRARAHLKWEKTVSKLKIVLHSKCEFVITLGKRLCCCRHQIAWYVFWFNRINISSNNNKNRLNVITLYSYASPLLINAVVGFTVII